MPDATPFEYRAIQETSCEGAFLVLGYPTPGLVGLVAAHHLVQRKDLELVGAFEGEALATRVVLRKGLPAPAVRLYVGEESCGLDGECDRLAVCVSDAVLPPNLQRPFARMLVQWARRQGIRQAIALEAVPVGPAEAVRGAASTPQALEALERHGIARMDDVSVGGLTGALLAEAAEQGFALTVLFVEARGEIQDPGAAAAALEVVDRLIVRIHIDAEPLKKAAEEVSRQLQADLTNRRAQYEANIMYG